MSYNDFSKKYFTVIYLKQNSQERFNVFRENLKIIYRFVKEGKLLDIGCAYGEFLSLAQQYFEVSGVDISAFALASAKKRLKNANLQVIDGSKEKLPYKNESFDVVTCFDVIEHLANTQFLFSEVYRVLKKNGVFFITTPGHETLFSNFFGRFVADDPTHVNKNNYHIWQKMLVTYGFSKLWVGGTLCYGFPPTTALRNFFSKLYLPVYQRVIFSPTVDFAATVYLVLRK